MAVAINHKVLNIHCNVKNNFDWIDFRRRLNYVHPDVIVKKLSPSSFVITGVVHYKVLPRILTLLFVLHVDFDDMSNWF